MIATILTRHQLDEETHLATRTTWQQPTANPAEGSTDTDRTTAERKRVLVVDDESLIADSIAEILNRNGFDAVSRYSADDALQITADGLRPDIMLADVMMPGTSGVQLAKAVSAMNPAVRILLFSGNASASQLVHDALREGLLFEILAKPVHPVRLLKALQS
jgi:DNA-binding NtrC family response regulator